jgi:hypothetical protein
MEHSSNLALILQDKAHGVNGIQCMRSTSKRAFLHEFCCNKMDLCEMCQQIDIWKWIVQDNEDKDGWMEPGTIEHHESYVDLCQSASQGCRLCILLRHALLDSMHDYAVKDYATDWQPSTVETYLLDQRNFSQERFFIKPQYYKPGDGNDFISDMPLLRGFYYMKTSPEYSPLYFGPLLNFKTSHGQ